MPSRGRPGWRAEGRSCKPLRLARGPPRAGPWWRPARRGATAARRPPYCLLVSMLKGEPLMSRSLRDTVIPLLSRVLGAALLGLAWSSLSGVEPLLSIPCLDAPGDPGNIRRRLALRAGEEIVHAPAPG